MIVDSEEWLKDRHYSRKYLVQGETRHYQHKLLYEVSIPCPCVVVHAEDVYHVSWQLCLATARRLVLSLDAKKVLPQ